MQEFIYNDIFAAGLATDVKIGETVQKMLQKVGQKYKDTNNGVVYEQYSIDVANQTEGINVLTKKVAEGGIPDIHAELFGFDFFVHDGMMGTIIPTPLLKAAGMGNSKAGAKASNGKTYYANMQISGVEFDIDNIGEMYHAKKDYPVDLIGVQGKGLQHFGENNLSLNIPRFG